jgi:hypothetical protein
MQDRLGARIKRWEHEAIIDALQRHLDQALDIIRIRRKTVETPVRHHCLDGLDALRDPRLEAGQHAASTFCSNGSACRPSGTSDAEAQFTP